MGTHSPVLPAGEAAPPPGTTPGLPSPAPNNLGLQGELSSAGAPQNQPGTPGLGQELLTHRGHLAPSNLFALPHCEGTRGWGLGVMEDPPKSPLCWRETSSVPAG